MSVDPDQRPAPPPPAPPPLAPAPPDPAQVERGGRSAQFDPNTPADKQLRDWGWDPNRLNPAQLEVMARHYAHPDKPLMPHVDAAGHTLSPDALGLDDLANAWLHANPDVNGGTKFLALIGNKETRDKISGKDDQLQKVNAASLGLRPSELGYRTATLNGTAPEVSDMVTAADNLKAAVDKVNAIHGRVRELYNGEYTSDCLTKVGKARVPKLDEHVKSLSADSVAARKAVVDTGSGAQKAFRGFHDVVDGYREDIARVAAATQYSEVAMTAEQQPFGRPPVLFPHKDAEKFLAGDPKASVAEGAKQAADAGAAMGKAFSTPIDSVTPVEIAAPPQQRDPDGHHAQREGLGGVPGGSGHPVLGGAGSNTNSEPPPGSPQAAMPPPVGAGMPFGSGAPQIPQPPPIPQVAPPLSGGGPDTRLASDHNADHPQQDSLDPSQERDRRTSQESRIVDAALAPAPMLRPGDSVRPGQLGSDMKPLDKDGDGRMDADAIAPTQHNMDADHDGKPDRVATAVMIGGEPHAVSVDDPRLLEMMNTLGAADPDHPVDVLDAAARAGMPLSGYGQFLDDPMTAKTGDVVTGSKGTGMYLEGGQVLMEDGLKKPLMDVFEYRPPHSGFFRLELPELPAGDEEVVGAVAAPPGAESASTTPAVQIQDQALQTLVAEPEPPPAPPTAAVQQTEQVAKQESELPFPTIATETAPRSW